jgi:hypothetical protein
VVLAHPLKKPESLKMMGVRAATVSAKENTEVGNVSGMIENI